MATYIVKVRGTERVKAMLDGASQRLRNLTQPLEKAGLLMLRSIDTNFRTAGRPITWRSLSRAYLVKKLAQGYSALPLTRTGLLRRSITKRVANNKLAVGTSVKYGRFHQTGTRRMPARPFLVFQSEDLERIERLITQHIIGKG